MPPKLLQQQGIRYHTRHKKFNTEMQNTEKSHKKFFLVLLLDLELRAAAVAFVCPRRFPLLLPFFPEESTKPSRGYV